MLQTFSSAQPNGNSAAFLAVDKLKYERERQTLCVRKGGKKKEKPFTPFPPELMHFAGAVLQHPVNTMFPAQQGCRQRLFPWSSKGREELGCQSLYGSRSINKHNNSQSTSPYSKRVLEASLFIPPFFFPPKTTMFHIKSHTGKNLQLFGYITERIHLVLQL